MAACDWALRDARIAAAGGVDLRVGRKLTRAVTACCPRGSVKGMGAAAMKPRAIKSAAVESAAMKSADAWAAPVKTPGMDTTPVKASTTVEAATATMKAATAAMKAAATVETTTSVATATATAMSSTATRSVGKVCR